MTQSDISGNVWISRNTDEIITRSERSCAEKRKLCFHLHRQAKISPTPVGEVMCSLGFTPARVETCEMATGWDWVWSPLSPWSTSQLIPACIPQQAQPAAPLLGHPLGLPGAAAGRKINLGNTQKPPGQSLEWKLCKETSCFLHGQVIQLTYLCLTFTSTHCGVPMSSWLSHGGGSQGPHVLTTSIPTHISSHYPLPTFIIQAGMSLSLGCLGLLQI